VVIWTTTPWTLPGQPAIVFHPDYEYSAAVWGRRDTSSQPGLLESVAGNAAEVLGGRSRPLSRRSLERSMAPSPISFDRDSLLALGEYVTLDAGTRLRPHGPGHGYDDYVTGVSMTWKFFCARSMTTTAFTGSVERFGGLHVFEANDLIVRHLKRDGGGCLHEEEFQHTYPHCWRCHRPIIFRATAPSGLTRWNADGFRERVLEGDPVRAVDSVMGRGTHRQHGEGPPDWCISRQGDWGVPIIAFYCAACSEILLTGE